MKDERLFSFLERAQTSHPIDTGYARNTLRLKSVQRSFGNFIFYEVARVWMENVAKPEYQIFRCDLIGVETWGGARRIKLDNIDKIR